MWITTYTGRRFYPLEPDPRGIDIEDIAHALSLQCRFNGHCRRHYSVAQHSIHVSQLVPEKHALSGLLHDAAEAYLPDVCRPIKSAFPALLLAEARLMRVLAEEFRLPLPLPEVVKAADSTALLAEGRALFPSGTVAGWSVLGALPPARPIQTGRWAGPRVWEARFLRRFGELWPAHAARVAYD